MAKRNIPEEMSSHCVEAFSTPVRVGSLSPDWRDTKTASQCLDHLCLSNHLSDVTLGFSKEPSVKLPAHKFVESMRSRAFETLFYGKHGCTDSTVTIDDVGSETMLIVLRFMYTDKADISGKNVLKCLKGAKLYAIEGLTAKCSTFLEKNVNAGNVCTIYEEAIYYKMKELQTKCFRFMVGNASTDSFLKISKSTLVSLLKSDDLAENEENVFRAALSRAEVRCRSNKMNVTPENKRKCLGEAINEIRFPIMFIENFAKHVTPAGILTSDEQIMLYQYLASNGTSPLNKFVARERGGKIDMEKYGNPQLYPHIYGYLLNIQLGPKHSQLRDDASDAVKLKDVTGTFAARVKRVYDSSDRGKRYDFNVNEDKLTFNPPCLISNQISVVFETKQKKKMGDKVSYKVKWSANINGKTVSITTVPEGLTSICFAK